MLCNKELQNKYDKFEVEAKSKLSSAIASLKDKDKLIELSS